MTTGKRIQQARKQGKMSQRDLGIKLGVSASMIGQYENDLRKPKYETLLKIADAIGVDITVILGDELRQIYVDGMLSIMSSGHYFPTDSPITDIDNVILDLGIKKPGYVSEYNLLKAFSTLNDEGQQKAVERVEELTEIPKYKK